MHDIESNGFRNRRRLRAEADFRLLRQEWRSLCVPGETIPLWSSFDPVLRHPQMVGNLFVLAREPADWRFRLIGSALRGILQNASGRTIDDVYPTPIAQPLQRHLDEIATTRTPVQATHAAKYDRVLHSMTLSLPFHQGDHLVSRIVTAMFYLDEFAPQGPFLGVTTEIERDALDLVD